MEGKLMSRILTIGAQAFSWVLLYYSLLIWFTPGESVLLVLCILLHELGHGVVAIKLGYSVHLVGVPFFGAAAAVSEYDKLNKAERIFVTLGGLGVTFFLVFVGFTIMLLEGSQTGFGAKFAMLNAVLLTWNLLPIGFLDGGRLLEDAFSSLKRNARHISVHAFSIFIVAFMVIQEMRVSVFYLIFAVLFAWKGWKTRESEEEGFTEFHAILVVGLLVGLFMFNMQVVDILPWWR